MGTADLVPGVSGGTIALVLGIYERLVASIKEGSSALGSLLRADVRGAIVHLRKVEWVFLLPLLAGILTAVVVLSGFLEHQLEERPTILAALFLGLVIASIVIAWSLVKSPGSSHVVVGSVVALLTFVLLGFGEGRTSGSPSLLVFFGAGALAICAMILPGISGSFILLLLSKYEFFVSAFNQRDLVSLALAGIGAAVGIVTFAQLLSWLFKRYHNLTVALLTGFMIGSLRKVWPWKLTLETVIDRHGVEVPILEQNLLPPLNGDLVLPVIFALVGFVCVMLIERLAGSKQPTEQRL